MNFTYLKTFVMVCKSGNFTEAANKLFIPQPTVSNRIRYLEEELEQNLFLKKETGKRSITLTQAGEKFLPYAQNIIKAFNTVKEELNASNQNRRIRVGCTIPHSHPLILSKVDSLFKGDELFNIQIASIEEADVISEIIENTIDLAFVTEPIHSESIESTLLASENLELILPFHHELNHISNLTDLSLLENENIILFDNQFLSIDFESQIIQHCNHIITTKDMEFIKIMLLQEKAIAILPSSFLPETREGKFNKITISEEVQDEGINYYMVYNQKNHDVLNNFNEKLLTK